MAYILNEFFKLVFNNINILKIYALEKEESCNSNVADYDTNYDANYENDHIDRNINYKITDEDAIAYIKQQTGFSRIKDMFFPDTYLRMSPQIELAVNTMVQTTITFAIVSSVFGGLAARDKFLLKAQHKSFTTKFIANRGFNDASLLGTLRYGVKFGSKAGLFSGIFMITSQTVSVYRNKTGYLEHIIAGGLTCGILRINGGPKAFIGAGTIGLFLGLVGGVFINFVLKKFGYSQEKLNLENIQKKYAFIRPPID